MADLAEAGDTLFVAAHDDFLLCAVGFLAEALVAQRVGVKRRLRGEAVSRQVAASDDVTVVT